MKKSLLWTFTLPIVAFFILATIGLAWFFTSTYAKTYKSDLKDSLAAQAQLLGSEIESLDIASEYQNIQIITDRFAENLDARVTIILADGSVLADSESDPNSMDNHIDRPEVQQVIRGETGFQTRYSKTLKTDLVYVAIGKKVANEELLIIRISKPLTVVAERMRSIRQTIFLGGFICSAITFLIILFISRQTIRPILELTKSAQKFAKGDFRSIPLSNSKTEIGELTRSFDHMALQIQSQLAMIQGEKKKLASIIDQLVVGVIVISPEGHITLVNPSAEELFDLKSEEILNKTLAQSLQFYQLDELWHQAIEKGGVQRTFLDLKANQKYLLAIASPFEGAEAGTVLILIQDLTKQRSLERMRQDFLSNVSHELRTPLASLSAITETLQEKALEDPPAARRFLQLMEVEIEKLTQMVMELLELSKIESGRLPMNKTAIHVFDLLSPPLERMKTLALRAGIEMSLDCPKQLPMVEVDVERFEQVLVNLIHNAIKFTPAGGSIILTATSEPGNVIIQIMDTGGGISEENLPRIFERFYKTDRSRSTGGTGLGLSIAKHVIEAHGGKIWVRSRENEGTTIHFSIPIS